RRVRPLPGEGHRPSARTLRVRPALRPRRLPRLVCRRDRRVRPGPDPSRPRSHGDLAEAAMNVRRVLVTGVDGPVGRAAAQRLAGRRDVEVIGVAVGPRTVVANVEVGLQGLEYAEVADLLRGRRIDTIVHVLRPAKTRTRSVTDPRVIA